MERKTGFRECPKCGLRNRPNATQCDFCGQNLGSSDDWQQHISDLESLNKMELRRPLDERTSKRIESTIIRKDASANRNLEIKEAGNIGKVLKDLDAPPAKDRELKEERDRHPPVPEKLRIKEAPSVPPVEKRRDESITTARGATIAEILSAPAKEAASEPEPPVIEPVPSPTPAEDVAEEGEANEVVEPPHVEADAPPAPEKEDIAAAPAMEPPVTEKAEEAAPVVEPLVEMVPAKGVTLEIVQTPQQDVVPKESSPEGQGEVTISSDDAHETIKLKLVEVVRPKERLTPMAVDSRPQRMPALAVLAIGTAFYLVVLGLTAVGALGTLAGIGGGAISSCMIIYGAAVVYPSLQRKKDDEVYICPKCHEHVEERSVCCPACGAEFESKD